MKKALFKDSVKEIKNTYKRFISILLMAFLGVGFFAGIKASAPDMIDTIDSYYKEQNVYDIQTLSTLGLTKEDVEELGKIEGISSIQGTYETDGKIEIDNRETVSRILTLNEINKPVLIEGKLPEKQDECVVEDVLLKANNKKIGDKITVEIEQISNDDGDKKDYLKQKEMTIVGTVKSPLYISRDRGTTNLGSGKINYYMYVHESNINVPEIYTTIYAKVDTDKTTSSKKYEDKVEEVKDKIEAKKEERQKFRYDTLVGKATKKVEDAKKELNDKKADGEKEIADAEKKIQDGKNEIAKNEKKIRDNEAKANREFRNAETKIANGRNEIKKNEDTLIQKEDEFNKTCKELEKNIKNLENNKLQVKNGLDEINKQISNIELALQNPQLPEDQKQIMTSTKIGLEKKKAELVENEKQIDKGINDINVAIQTGKTEIQNGKTKIQQAKNELNSQENKLKKTKNSTYSQINKGKNELEKARREVADGEKELNDSKKEFDEKIKDAETKLIDAKTKIADIEEPKWYILDRYGNAGYNGFTQDAKSIENLGKVFPIVFFVVATLISLTSMTRMVEEQRVQIGTLKALGYNKIQISAKYILYASLACIIGGLLGMSVGFVLLPKLIWMMYSMMYRISDIKIEFNLLYGGMGILLISACIIGATIYTVMKELVQTPAMLMRPKAPKMGKRVFLERIKFIWKRLSFSRKVTVRNIFRYKKRFLMTIIGICGCTSLILAGYGIKDSITSLLPTQFEKVHHYDMQINLKNGLENSQKEEYIGKIEKREEFKNVTEVYMNSSKVIKDGKEEQLQIIIPKDNIDNAITIADAKTKEKIQLEDDKIYLTDKVAQLIGAKEGDKIIIKDNDDNEKEVTISRICENYIQHYMYMTKATYEKLYNKEYKTNILLANYSEIENEEALAKELMENKEVAGIMRISVMIESLDDMMKSLNYVVVILIVSAGLLAFVVLYNLSNVNISERIRELATIKVLGFYDKEVYSYITRETVILTIIGIILGIAGGYILNNFILGTCEIDMLRFVRIIKPMSYVYSIAITLAFTGIVNLITYFALKKIDMIESLKSVE